MSKGKYNHGIFIFRRDLRIEDNIGFIRANKECKCVTPIFIFTPEQISTENKYRSDNAIQFMFETLNTLEQSIEKYKGHMNYFKGDNVEVIAKLHALEKIDAIYCNMDITPYAKRRDKDIIKWCKLSHVTFHTSQDYYLYEPGTITTDFGTTYEKYTPFYNKAIIEDVQRPQFPRSFQLNNKRLGVLSLESMKASMQHFHPSSEVLIQGGRKNGKKMLGKIVNHQNYGKHRSDLTYKTTNLSAYLKFGALSIREVYYAMEHHLGKKSDLIKQLVWREFYAHLLYAKPYVLGKALKPKYNELKWNKSKKWLNAWKEGKTGFPIVDAGMREMNETGFMHNRSRLITASFLIKTLLIDWQEGEKYFATKLVDYDPSSNNGNWQWVASTGADSQPYFRIFNPWSQSTTHDPDAKYIKKWVPELVTVNAGHLHEWNLYHHEHKEIDYPKPIVDYKTQREKALHMYKSVL